MASEQVVIYDEAGTVGVMLVSEGLDPVQVATSSLTAGTPFIVENVSDLPTDLSPKFIETWEIDFDAPDGWGQNAQHTRIIKGEKVWPE